MTSRLLWVGLLLLVRAAGAEPAPQDSLPAGHTHSHSAAPTPAHDHAAMEHDHAAMGHDHAAMGHEGHEGHSMPALFGPYPMQREASGTAWQPDETPHEGGHIMTGPWSSMVHGYFDIVGRNEGGPRGNRKVLGASMLMASTSRTAGPGRFGLRTMLSTDPFTVGKKGYPLLLQTGETADGEHHLIDRQHPHDLFMELATTYSVSDATRSAFVYFGYPGEPALGPPVFMHRFSGTPFPESPITHHWLDSTHITFGVATVGVVAGDFKLEGSSFTGREPDAERYDFDRARFDSRSARVSWNPDPHWSLQASAGHIVSPEELEPDVDVDRRTISVARGGGVPDSPWQVTLAWGQNRGRPGPILDAFLLEGVRASGRHVVFARAERVEKNELFDEADPRAGDVFTVGRLGVGYALVLHRDRHLTFAVGGEGALSFVPEALRDAYGDTPVSGSVFVRTQLR
jgi:hypothetical protein